MHRIKFPAFLYAILVVKSPEGRASWNRKVGSEVGRSCSNMVDFPLLPICHFQNGAIKCGKLDSVQIWRNRFIYTIIDTLWLTVITMYFFDRLSIRSSWFNYVCIAQTWQFSNNTKHCRIQCINIVTDCMFIATHHLLRVTVTVKFNVLSAHWSFMIWHHLAPSSLKHVKLLGHFKSDLVWIYGASHSRWSSFPNLVSNKRRWKIDWTLWNYFLKPLDEMFPRSSER